MPVINDVDHTYKTFPDSPAEIRERLAALSPRAQAIYEKLCNGAWYYSHAEKTPVSMRELLEARLVTYGARYPQMHSCFVPVNTHTISVESFYSGHCIDPEVEDDLASLQDYIEVQMRDLSDNIKKLQALRTAHRLIGWEQLETKDEEDLA